MHRGIREGGIDRTIGVQTQWVSVGRTTHTGELPAGQDLFIRLNRNASNCSAKARIGERRINRSVGVEASRVGASGSSDGCKLATRENLSIGLKGERSYRSVEGRVAERRIDRSIGIEASKIIVSCAAAASFREITASQNLATRLEGHRVNAAVDVGIGERRVYQTIGRHSGQVVARSEERRVGKECRSRWSPY